MAARAQAAGGIIETAPFDTPGVARTCVIQDPDCGVFGLWEGRGRAGADVQNDTGTMWWVELLARDINATRDFYCGLFGWTFEETLKFGDIPYTIFRVGEESVFFWRDVPNVGRFGMIQDAGSAEFCVMRPLPRS